MSRKPKARTLDTLQFALELLKRIPRVHAVSAKDLHQQLLDAGLDRDLRTVQRQLEELSEHFDIERDDRTRPYGYRWKQNARGFSLPGLNEKESLLLTLAEQHLRNLLPVEVLRSLDPFFAEARRNLSPGSDGGTLEREWLQKVRVVSTSQPLLPPAIRPGVLEAVSTALYKNLWLDVDYTTADRRKLKARVMPLGLAQQGTRLYLVCRFEGFENERSLALNRMTAVDCTHNVFERPTQFDLEKFDSDGRFGIGDGKNIRISFRITRPAGAHLLESRLSRDQTVSEDGDGYVISATVSLTEQLKWWLRGFGAEVTVLAPPEFARAVRAREEHIGTSSHIR